MKTSWAQLNCYAVSLVCYFLGLFLFKDEPIARAIMWAAGALIYSRTILNQEPTL